MKESKIVIRKRAITFVMLLVIFFEIALGIVFVNQQELHHSMENSEEFTKVENSYNYFLKDNINFYKQQSIFIAKQPEIIESIKDKDKEKLYKFAKSKWQMLNSENPFLHIMHFHLANGESLLRVHSPEIHDHNISKDRAMIRDIHKNHKSLSVHALCVF